MNKAEPLAYRMRPKTLEEYEGQEQFYLDHQGVAKHLLPK